MPVVNVFALQTRGIQVLIKDAQGKQVGLYKESHALVIGASHYTEGWPKLPGVKEDVQSVNKILEEHGFEVVTVNNPDSEQLNRVYKDFINTYGRKPENRLLLYFAGHGYTKKMSYGSEMGYIVPVDAPNPENDIDGFVNKAMDMQQIEVFAKRIESKHALFLFDSCFSGSLFALSRAIPKSISYKTSWPVRQFITAGSAEETVPDRSTFREQFVAALEGEGDVNEDGYITGTELGVFLQDTVINYTKESQHPQYGKIRDRNLDKGDFVFALGRDVYEQPSKPKVVEEFDFGDIEKKRKKLQEEREVKTEWTKWQKKFDAAYDEALRYDKDTDLKAGDKAKVWKRLANSFSQDNPYSTEDQLIRSKAVERMEYWKNYREPTPPVTIQQEPSYGSAISTTLRSSYETLSASQVQSIPNVSIRKKKDWGFYGHSTIKHDYSLKTIRGDKIVVDNATGLMWHQNGSDKYMKWNKAKKWIKKLNKRSWLNKGGYAGYHDWRLPTLEEAASLLEPSKRNGLYIDPVFNAKQSFIWTGDKKGSEAAWTVYFYNGHVFWYSTLYDSYYVRPVRSVE
jgi:menaquinone-dependent protoporphyrinogen IX oxidase